MGCKVGIIYGTFWTVNWLIQYVRIIFISSIIIQLSCKNLKLKKVFLNCFIAKIF